MGVDYGLYVTSIMHTGHMQEPLDRTVTSIHTLKPTQTPLFTAQSCMVMWIHDPADHGSMISL